MRFISRGILIVTMLLVSSGCGLLRKKQKPSPVVTPPESVDIGYIEMVNGDQKFVLIHTTDRSALPAETILTVNSDQGETARLKVAPERKGVYLTADIVSGSPQKGDVVAWNRKTSPPPAPVEPSARVVVPRSEAPPLPQTPSASVNLTPPPPPP